MNKILKTFIIIILFSSFFSCKSMFERYLQENGKQNIIRVKIKITGNAVIKNKNLKIIDIITKKALFFENENLNISIYNNELNINNKLFSKISVCSNEFKTINVNGIDYFGFFKIANNNGELEIINYIPIETYLLSVVPAEMPLRFDISALKAQAVIARTYSYYFIDRYYNKRNFDVDNTMMYQVYNGFSTKYTKDFYEKLLFAVNDTKGEVLIFKRKPILAYFHSNSGGRIRSGLEYFGINSDFPYLISKEDPYSIGMSGDKWSLEMTKDIFFKSISEENTDLSSDNIVYDEYHFVKEININLNTLSAKEIRKRIGYLKFKSERFNMIITDKSFIFNGIGFGHGVGLSQWGAEGMAEAGFDYKQIVSFYYPETNLVKFNIKKDYENREF